MHSKTFDPIKLKAKLIKLNKTSYGSKLFENMNDVDSFLLDKGFFKKAEQRLLAYFFKTHLLTFENYQNELVDILQQSQASITCEEYQPHKTSNYRQIVGDIRRSTNFITMFIQDLAINDIDFDYIKEALLRILTTISLKYSDIGYIQGYDRYAIVLYLNAIKSCKFLELSYDFAAALIMELVAQVIRLSNIINILQKPLEFKIFSQIDELVSKLDDIATRLPSLNSINYGIFWRIAFFVDNYHMKELMLIWDQILCNSSKVYDLDTYFAFLIVAHVEQIISQFKITDECEFYIIVTTYTKYDALAAVKRAESMFKGCYHDTEIQEKNIIISKEDIEKIRKDIERNRAVEEKKEIYQKPKKEVVEKLIKTGATLLKHFTDRL